MIYPKKLYDLVESSQERKTSWHSIMEKVAEIEKIIGHPMEIRDGCYISWWYSPKKHTQFSQNAGGNYTWKEKRTLFSSIGGKFYTYYVGVTSPEKIRAKTKREAIIKACNGFVKWYNKTMK